MLNQVAETLSDKTVSQYKVIESKYNILTRYLKNIMEHNYVIDKDDIEVILNSLEPEEGEKNE